MYNPSTGRLTYSPQSPESFTYDPMMFDYRLTPENEVVGTPRNQQIAEQLRLAKIKKSIRSRYRPSEELQTQTVRITPMEQEAIRADLATRGLSRSRIASRYDRELLLSRLGNQFGLNLTNLPQTQRAEILSRIPSNATSAQLTRIRPSILTFSTGVSPWGDPRYEIGGRELNLPQYALPGMGRWHTSDFSQSTRNV